MGGSVDRSNVDNNRMAIDPQLSSSGWRVIRVRRFETITRPQIKSLILRAVAAVEYPGTTPEDLYAEFVGAVAADTFGLFVGIAGNEPRAVVAAILPISAVMIAPQAILAYSESRPELTRMVALRLKAWLLEHGYHRMLAHNFYRKDGVFIRGFRHF